MVLEPVQDVDLIKKQISVWINLWRMGPESFHTLSDAFSTHLSNIWGRQESFSHLYGRFAFVHIIHTTYYDYDSYTIYL